MVMAMTPSGVIGRAGKLPWPMNGEDMRLFKRLTWGHLVLMGSRTWESLPVTRRPLPERTNVILSSQSSKEDDKGAIRVKSVEEAIEHAIRLHHKHIFVIGGASVYEQCLRAGIIDTIHLSVMEKEYEGDTIFDVKLLDEFIEVSTEYFWHAGFKYQVLRRLVPWAG